MRKSTQLFLKIFFLVLLLASFFISLEAYAQVFRPKGFEKSKNTLRTILSSFQFNMDLGYGFIPQTQEFQNISVLNNVVSTSNLSALGNGQVVIKSKANAIPISWSVHYKLKEFRIGFQYAVISYNSWKTDDITVGSNEYSSSTIELPTVSNTRVYGYLGIDLKYLLYWTHTPEIKIGSGSFKELGVDLSSVVFDLGMNMEYHFSEMLRFRIRPSVEYVSYSGKNNLGNVSSFRPSFYITFGFSINIARLPMCTIYKCETTVNHLHPSHSRKEFRSNRYTLFQRDNPMYGETLRNQK